jgi:hypothetical protein
MLGISGGRRRVAVSEAPVLPDATVQRLVAILDGQPVDLAYYLHPLPKGLLTASQGGLAILFAHATTSTQRYDLAQRLRFGLMGLLPPGHTEVIALNDARPAIVMAALSSGALVFNRDEAARLRYETMVFSEMLDFEASARRFLGAGGTG